MAKEIQCDTHGTGRETFVCSHLAGDAAGLGFNRDEPSEQNPFPDAWCDDCEVIRAAHGGWNEEAEKLTKLSLLCSGCYERARIRNTRTAVTLDDLARLRWKCSTCDEWHYGPCLDFGYSSPYYWRAVYDSRRRDLPLLSDSDELSNAFFLDEDFCQIRDDFFVRGLIQLPIIGTAKNFCWGVWGSLARANFELLLEKGDSVDRVELPPMFSWLSSQIAEYPDTLSLRMHAHQQAPGKRPLFELDRADHPLSLEFYEGITPDRVREIMLRRLPPG